MDKLLGPIYNVYHDVEPVNSFGAHSYLLKRKGGNVLLPRFGVETTISEELDAIGSVGGIKWVFITDYHFGGKSCESLASFFGARCASSVIEQPKLRKKGLLALDAFPFERHFLEEDLEIIPVPGHTSGGVCLRWVERRCTYLFTGDFLYHDGKGWVPGAKTRRKIESSLQLVKELEFDYLVGCGSDFVECPYIKLSTQAQKEAFIDEILSAFKK